MIDKESLENEGEFWRNKTKELMFNKYMEYWYYKTEWSNSDEPHRLFTTKEIALKYAIKEWESVGEEYDEDLTWFTKVIVIE